jgi:hydroxymethylbilane synthase
VADELNFRVGTRESILARRQTDLALQKILSFFPACRFEIVTVKTAGDKQLNMPLALLGGSGVFVKELEEALLDGRVDFVVHSLKDLPVNLPDNLCLAATIERADPRDVLVNLQGFKFDQLPPASRLATSSRRRAAQLAALRSDLQFVDLRGNLQTRLRKLEEGQCDAMVLAAAGLLRVGLSERICQYFEPEESMPAVGQGALAIECRQDNLQVLEIMERVNDRQVWLCTAAERAFLRKLGGGCAVPAGALAKLTGSDEIELSACIAALDGSRLLKGSCRGLASRAEQTGVELAEQLLAGGAGVLIESLLTSSAAAVFPP